MTTNFLWPGFILFNERLQWHQVLGIAAIIGGSLLVAHKA